MSEAGPRVLIPALWLAWLGYWWVAARTVKPARWREPAGAAAWHGIPFLLCILLLALPAVLPPGLTARFCPRGPALPALGTMLVAAGLGFAAWARVHLGRNWSSTIEVKQEHRLIRSGPYGIVRHPIYAGLIVALAGTALAIGEWRGLLALAFAGFGILVRVRREEAQMRRAFPEYAGYRRQTAALIPFLL